MNQNTIGENLMSLNSQVQNLTNNFSELVKSVANMHKDLAHNLKILEMKHITTVNNQNQIQEQLRQISKQLIIQEDDRSQKTLNNSFKIQHPLSKLEDSMKKIRKQKKLEELQKNPVKKDQFISSPQQVVREFRAYTESDMLSQCSKDKFFKNIKQPKIKQREDRVDSFFSKRIKPMDFLLDIPKNIDLDNLDQESMKTPKKDQIYNQNKIQSSDSDNDSKYNYSRRNSNINIRNFDDFKNVLKDLKLTLNTSNYSNFQENLDKNFEQLENRLKQYSQLDQDIENLYQREKLKEKNKSFLGKLVIEDDQKNFQKSQSLNFGSGSETQMRQLTLKI